MLKPMTTHRRANGEGSISFDRQKQRWVARALIPATGRYRKVVRKSKSEAQAALRRLLADVEHGTVPVSGELTVKTVAERYRDRTLAGRAISPATRDREAWCVDRIIDALGPRELRSLTVSNVEEALDGMALDGLGRASLDKVKGTFARVLDGAIKRGELSVNVARHADLPPDADRTRPRRSLTAEEMRSFVRACRDKRLGPLFVFMLGTGCRPGEACGLRWDAVDLDAGTVAIRSARRTGEGGRVEITEDLKTEQSRRTLALPSWTLDEMRRHRDAQEVERSTARVWHDPQLVFATSTGTPVGGPAMRKALDEIADRAGVGRLTPNELRHTAASLMVDAGLPLEHVAPVLGHRTTRMLEMTYRHAVRPSIDAHVAVLDRLVTDASD
jgi:integrase